ncbi:MAG: 50S ribosomal protein L4 [Chloroflexi bacterium]|nr:50S ribosomal protein L4 [Chloroflexota bacterium]
MELPVKNPRGEVVRSIQVSDAVFGVPLKGALVHQVMVGQLANQRQGTHATKDRGEVRGGGRKPWRQKGTGRARQGSIRAPQWRHGGVVFGPTPREYRQYTPKRMRRLAIRSLLSEKARNGEITVVDALDLAAPKTKEMKGVLQALGIQKKCLILLREPQQGVVLSARNLPGVKACPAHVLNTLDLLNYDHLLITEDGVRRVEELWAQERPRRGAKARGEVAASVPPPGAA